MFNSGPLNSSSVEIDSKNVLPQQTHDVVLTLIQRCMDVNNIVTTLKQRRVFTGSYYI